MQDCRCYPPENRLWSFIKAMVLIGVAMAAIKLFVAYLVLRAALEALLLRRPPQVA